MFLVEPPPTQADVHFRLLGMPVRIHPFFWVITLLLGMSGSDRNPPEVVLSWVAAVLVSILVHELGHAMLQRRYGGHPRIVLYGLGGLAVCDDCDRSSRAQILISLAGPLAGFVLAALVLVAIRVLGHPVGLSAADNPARAMQGLFGLKILGVHFYWEQFNSFHVNLMIFHLLWINLMWGAVNLLPIYPLDGGRVSRELCLLGQPQRGMILSLQISTVAAAIMVVVGLSWGSLFVALFFGYLAYSNYHTLAAYRASLW